MSEDLKEKTVDWLKSEGYPLEYFTSAAFARGKYATFQGYFYEDPNTDKLREIDIVATSDFYCDETCFRIENVIECKSSTDKPWIVFTSPFHCMSSSACITQSISTVLVDSILWCEAGNSDLHSTQMFSCPNEAGFGGVQAFTQGKDSLYSAIQSVVSASIGIVKSYDRSIAEISNLIPTMGVLVLPVVVIKGSLFEAHVELESGDISLNEVDYTRLHWRGSSSFPRIATVDIVRSKYLDTYIGKRASDIEKVKSVFGEAMQRICRWIESNGNEELLIADGPHGILGLPHLLRTLKSTFSEQREKECST